MAPKTKKIIPNPELQKAMRGWAPVFGNSQDRTIVAKLELLQKKLQSVDNEILRGLKKDVGHRAFTSKMKEISGMERSLIAEITSRKQDF